MLGRTDVGSTRCLAMLLDVVSGCLNALMRTWYDMARRGGSPRSVAMIASTLKKTRPPWFSL